MGAILLMAAKWNEFFARAVCRLQRIHNDMYKCT